MASRNILHKSKLPKFLQWLDTQSIKHREGKGEYQLCQIYYNRNWYPIFSRIYMPEHLTINDKLIPLVMQFIDFERKITKHLP